MYAFLAEKERRSGSLRTVVLREPPTGGGPPAGLEAQDERDNFVLDLRDAGREDVRDAALNRPHSSSSKVATSRPSAGSLVSMMSQTSRSSTSA